MGSAIGRFVRVAVRDSALLASAAIITAVSQVNMAVAGIGGIGGGGKGRNGLLDEERKESTAHQAVAALSVFHLQDAVRSGKSEWEIRAMANEAGYTLAIT